MAVDIELLELKDNFSVWRDKINKMVRTINNLAVLAHPIGDLWISVDNIVPQNGILYDGRLYSRNLYPDLFAWLVANSTEEKPKIISEAAWQEYSKNNILCPFFSYGTVEPVYKDDTEIIENVDLLNFRVPSISAQVDVWSSEGNELPLKNKYINYFPYAVGIYASQDVNK